MTKLSDRRAGALKRLQAQLVSDTKTEKKTNKKISLSESDKKRIEKEITALSK